MIEFDNLPHKSRLLILATLDLEIASEKCKNIFELARKRYQTVPDVWRDVCRKTEQPRCTMPPRVMGEEYAAISQPVWSKPAAPFQPAIGAAPESAKTAHAAATVAPSASAFAGTSANAKEANPVATPAPATTVSRLTVARPAPNRKIALAVGLAVIFALGIGLAVFAIPRSTDNPYASAATTISRPNETARAGSNNKAGSAPNSVPMPEGTVRRMDAINKSFSKQR